MLSKLPLLEFLSLYHCHFSIPDSLSKIFDYCTTLKGLHINNAFFEMDIDLIIPQQLEILDLTSRGSIKLNLDNSMNLQSLSVNCNSYLTIRVKDQFAFLEKVKLVGNMTLRVLGKWENLFTNVKELFINAFACYTLFGTFEDCSNEVSDFIFGTYHLGFLMIPYLENLMIEIYSNINSIFCAFPSGNRTITVKRIFMQKNGDYTESKHNLNQRPIIVEYSPGKESTEIEYTPSQWPINAHIYDYLTLNK